MPKYQGQCPVSNEVDLYSGCPFGCIYCIAKEKHSPEVLPVSYDEKLLTTNGSDTPVYLSPWTDAYPPSEEELNHTGSLVKHLSEMAQPFYVITRSLLVRRDIEIIRKSKNAFVAISLNTLDNSITDVLEPSAPTATERMNLIEELVKTEGLRTVVRIDPIIPAITEGERLVELLSWIKRVKPFAVGVETLRINKSISIRMQKALQGNLFSEMMKYYPDITETPIHPPIEWRLNLFQMIASELKNSPVRACFCGATLPVQITDWDCRGGYE